MTSPPIRIGVAVPRSCGTQWIRRALDRWGGAYSIVSFAGVIPQSPEAESVALWIAHQRFSAPLGNPAPILRVIARKGDPPEGFSVRAGDEKKLLALIRAWADPFPPAFEAFPDPLFLLDDRGRVLRANGAGRALLRLPAGAEEGGGPWMGSAVSDALAAGRPIAGQSLFLDEAAFMDAGGNRRTAGMRLWRRPGGEVTALVREDLGRAGLIRYREQSERLESVGRLAGGMAHDLNNILMVITSYAGLLKRRAGLSGAPAGFLEEIHKASDRAVRLTDQLLSFARRQALQPRGADLGALVSGRAPRLREILGPSIRLEEIPAPALPAVSVDTEKFALALDQLASNARDAMPNGGTVIVETGLFEGGREWEDLPPIGPGPFVMLTFSDTGEGMPPDRRDRIFDPFFTTKGKGKGTGMGMAVVYGLVKQSGGFIHCASEPLIGTTLRILLPATESPPAPPPERADRPAELNGRGRTVLVIEDEEAVLSSIVSILESLGFSVVAAPTGEEAVAMARRMADPPHLIISDVVLPGMNGKEAVERILEARPGVPVLFMSGYSDNILARRGILPSGLAYLQKPFTVETLIVRIAALL